ncbi:MAG: porin family protein [Chlorobiaceae bacterium]|nr:porin family protein [Chlorobiaceae bacterium]
MKKTLFLAMLFACLGTVPAYAGYYVSGSIGAALPGDVEYKSPTPAEVDANVMYDAACAFNGAFGYNFGNTRLEAAIGYQQNGFNKEVDSDGAVFFTAFNPVTQTVVTDIHLSLLTVMANGYYDFKAASGVKPYVMGGAGVAHFNSGDAWVDSTYFAWQLGAGIGVKLAKDTTLDLGYRLIMPVGVKDLDNWHVNWETHNIMAGVRYEF